MPPPADPVLKPVRDTGHAAALALAALLLGACTTAPPSLEPPVQIPHTNEPPMTTPLAASPEAAAAPSLPPALPVLPRPPKPRTTDATTTVLAWADRAHTLGNTELIQEISRLNDLSDSQRSATTDLQLAIALGLTKVPSDLPRAQALVQKVQAASTDEAQALQPLARLIGARLAEQKRLEDLLDKQATQMRDQQRRLDQLNERLEAMRAIERSLTAPRPHGGANGVPAPTPRHPAP